jgi:hypothetical protein
MNYRARRLALPAPERMATQLAAGRLALAGAFLAAPVPALRAMGADTATAQRISWLTRMMAVRDGALGLGAAMATRNGGDPRPWLLGGAVSDAVDAAVFAAAIKQGRLRGVGPALIVPGGVLAAGAGVLAAARLRRR